MIDAFGKQPESCFPTFFNKLHELLPGYHIVLIFIKCSESIYLCSIGTFDCVLIITDDVSDTFDELVLKDGARTVLAG